MISKTALWTLVLTTTISNGQTETTTTTATKAAANSITAVLMTEFDNKAVEKKTTIKPGTENFTLPTQTTNNSSATTRVKRIDNETDKHIRTDDKTSNNKVLDQNENTNEISGDFEVEYSDTMTSQGFNQTSDKSESNNSAAKITVSVVMSTMISIILLALVALRKYKKRQTLRRQNSLINLVKF